MCKQGKLYVALYIGIAIIYTRLILSFTLILGILEYGVEASWEEKLVDILQED